MNKGVIDVKFRSLAALLALSGLLNVPSVAVDTTPEIQQLSLPFWEGRLYVDRSIVAFWDSNGRERYPLSYNGTVYIPLRTAGEWMGAAVEWEQDSHTVKIMCGEAPKRYLESRDIQTSLTKEELLQLQEDRKNGVKAVLSPEISVLVDGEIQQFSNVLGQPVYPLVCRECVYLPVRSVAKLCGKQVLWLPFDDGQGGFSHIYLYDQPTQEQFATAKHFCTLSRQYTDQLKAEINTLAGEEALTEDILGERMEKLKEVCGQIIELPLPTAQVFYPSAYGVQGCAKEILVREIQPFLSPEQLLRPDFAAQGWKVHRDSFVNSVTVALGYLDRAVNFAQLLYDAVVDNPV